MSTREFRCIRYKDGTEELDDCKTDDPWNHHNLLPGGDKSKDAAIIAAYRKWLPASEK